MRQVTLGQGLKSSGQGLGCMSLTDSIYKSGITHEEAVALVKHAIENGVTHLDTALVYGPLESEIIIGKAIQGFPREKLLIATKIGIVIKENWDMRLRGDPEYVRRECEGCLERLQVEYIDLFYMHRIDPDTPIEVTMGELKKLVQEGKIRHIGLSEASPSIIRRAHKVHPVSAVQLEWSLTCRDVEEELIPTCRELGIGIVAYSPLGRGLLTLNITSKDHLAEGDVRKTYNPRFGDDVFEDNITRIEKIKELAERKSCSPAQIALAWVMAQGDDVCPIPGTSKIKNLESNIKANDVQLSKEEVELLSQLFPHGAIKGDRYETGHSTYQTGTNKSL